MASTFGGRPSRFDPVSGPSERRAIILPGRAYSPDAPLLEFGRLALLQHGWTVQQVWWDRPSAADAADPAAWVRGQLEAALTAESAVEPPLERLLVMAKSLGTLGATSQTPIDAAIWLTPLLTDAGCAAAIDRLARNGEPQLLVGGTEDEMWSSRTAHGLGCEVLEVPGADHGLAIPGDAVRTAQVHTEVTAAIDRFLATLTVRRDP
jgi:hypothetical protein